MSFTDTHHNTFITRSSYEGAWGKEVNVMDGFGSYRYPDGSEYRGGFHQGQFHGFGQLRLSQPYRFTFKGEFHMGRLVSIEDMWFSDGLHVKAEVTENGLDCSSWDYLTPADRRYQSERRYGQQPVGPTAFLTSKMLARNLPSNCYDTEEGVYNSVTCWLSDRAPPLQSAVYVGCQQEKDWIQNHCRKARTAFVVEPPAKMCRSIVENNLAVEKAQLKHTAIYAPYGLVDRERYYHKLGKQRGRGDKDSPPSARQRRMRPEDPAWDTEVCIRAYAQGLEQKALDLQEYRKLHPLGPRKRLRRPHHWSSTSDVRKPKSEGDASCESDSFDEGSMALDLKETYQTVDAMMDKKLGENFSVVQSNLIRRNSYMDMTRSVFEL